MAVAQQASPGSAPRLLGQHPGLGVLVMQWLPPADHALWKQQLREGHADLATAQAVGRMLARIHAFSAARPELAAQFDTDRIFYDIRLEPYLRGHRGQAPGPRAAVARAGGADAGPRGGAGAWRREPEEHPRRPARAGAAGCRMRLVGRPGLRPRVLPQPPAAQVPVDPGGARGLPGLLRRAGRGLPGRRRLGAARGHRAARRALAARPVAGARGRQVAGRIPHRRTCSARPCGAAPAR